MNENVEEANDALSSTDLFVHSYGEYVFDAADTRIRRLEKKLIFQNETILRNKF